MSGHSARSSSKAVENSRRGRGVLGKAHGASPAGKHQPTGRCLGCSQATSHRLALRARATVNTGLLCRFAGPGCSAQPPAQWAVSTQEWSCDRRPGPHPGAQQSVPLPSMHSRKHQHRAADVCGRQKRARRHSKAPHCSAGQLRLAGASAVRTRQQSKHELTHTREERGAFYAT